ncbi:uncharacterized protein LOC105381400 [Plutella xylostella]|uniref:uncharacterized protein LOC105381400 n=1 Tax=Plutella xylostella TaxID=51655 RepID=UPI002032502C|nr:uncharacterized protein LOC105381400 [Plutella xylostella]
MKFLILAVCAVSAVLANQPSTGHSGLYHGAEHAAKATLFAPVAAGQYIADNAQQSARHVRNTPTPTGVFNGASHAAGATLFAPVAAGKYIANNAQESARHVRNTPTPTGVFNGAAHAAKATVLAPVAAGQYIADNAQQSARHVRNTPTPTGAFNGAAHAAGATLFAPVAAGKYIADNAQHSARHVRNTPTPTGVFNGAAHAAKATAYAPVAAGQYVAGNAHHAAATAAGRSVRQVSPGEAQIVRSEFDAAADGYNYSYETGNGIVAEASGALKKVDDLSAVVVQGSYKYTSPDGTPVLVTYTADENGYQPQSDLLPVGPEVPVAIARALEYLKTHPQQVEPTKKY